MNEITTTPATARTDTVATEPTAAGGPAGVPAATVRRIGAGVTLGAVAFAGTFIVFGTQAEGIGRTFGDAGGLLFQLGLFGLLTAMWRTRATGVTRAARAMVAVEFGLLAVATVWSVLALVVPETARGTWFTVLDMFWPLSMLGMAVIGIKIAVAGRWRGILRAWPAVAETWALVTIPSMALGPVVASWVGAGHMVLGYGLLGVLLMARPQLTGTS